MAGSSRMQQQQQKGKEIRRSRRQQEKSFYCMFFPQQHGERLTIPPPFHRFLGNQPTGVVSLKPQSGNTWAVELSSDTQGFFFGNGWKEFVADHSLEMGDVLTFSYDGHSKFSVVVCDATTCVEKLSAFHAKPRKDEVIKQGKDEQNATDCNDVVVEAQDEEGNWRRI